MADSGRSPTDQTGQLMLIFMKTEKEIWLEKEIAKLAEQNLSADLTARMIEMVKDFANWAF